MGIVKCGNFFFDIEDFEVTETLPCHYFGGEEKFAFNALRLRKLFKNPVDGKEIEIIRWLSEDKYNEMLKENEE